MSLSTRVLLKSMQHTLSATQVYLASNQVHLANNQALNQVHLVSNQAKVATVKDSITSCGSMLCIISGCVESAVIGFCLYNALLSESSRSPLFL